MLQSSYKPLSENMQLSHWLINEIAHRMMDKLNFIRLKPKKILLSGFWPKESIEHLKTKYQAKIDYQLPNNNLMSQDQLNLKNITYLNSALATLIEQKKSYDLVLSNLFLQQFENAKTELKLLKKLLKKEGFLSFSSIGPQTLFQSADKNQIPPNWKDMHDLGDDMRALSFKDAVIDSERLELTYQSYSDIFRNDLLSLLPLLALDHLDDQTLEYIFKRLKKIQALYYLPIEIVYGQSFQSETAIQTKKGNETYIDLDQLLKKRD